MLGVDCCSKINNLDGDWLLNCIINAIDEHNIVQFNISMNDIQRMHIGQSTKELLHDIYYDFF